MGKTVIEIKERILKILNLLQKLYPNAQTELCFRNPYELLVAVVLSAQCTDKRVNKVTSTFFPQFPDFQSLAAASEDEIFHIIKSISYPNNKARHLKKAATMIVEEFHGELPKDTDKLQKLPGVGRKTAHVLASVLWKQPKLAVDTHVFRVSARLGMTKGAKTPLQAEMQLTKYIPPDMIADAHHWLILHGRYICLARKPKCNQCGLVDLCVWYLKNKQHFQ